MSELVANQTCPRRAENPGQWKYQGRDGWEQRNAEGLLWCSYCGSLQPNMFLSLMGQGATLGPTDKNYKVYVEDALGRHIGKFYFQHFDVPQMEQFIALCNAKPRTFNIGYPGHFYVLPFFMKMEQEEGG